MIKNPVTLGIDIGSISIAIVEINADKEIANNAYEFHHGSIQETLTTMLESFNLTEISYVAITANSPKIIRHAASFDARVSIITACKHLDKNPGSILLIGGEKFGLIQFDDAGNYKNFKSNTSCAAGTGSFLDQQAKRLNLSDISEFSRIASENKGEIPKIASRCSVFAKTDLIHAQQEGYTLAEICDGLCAGLAKNICDTLFQTERHKSKITVVGGVAKNQAVIKHIANLTASEVLASPYSHLYGAIGAALLQCESSDKKRVSFAAPEDLILQKTSSKNYHYKPLQLQLSQYPDFTSLEAYEYFSRRFPKATPVETDIYIKPTLGTVLPVYMGIDIGSTSTKAVITDEHGEVMFGLYTRTSGRPLEAVQTIFECLDELQHKKEINFNFLGIGTTGSGRKFVGVIIGADLILDEITAHARAAVAIDPAVDTIIEIGGQDAKFTTLKNGAVTFSVMNSVCAAGTGSFIEEQAKKLGCPLAEYNQRAENTAAPLSSDRCTVFMERDLNHYLSEGYQVNEILASILHSVRDNYLQKVALPSLIGSKIFFQGATAKNKALVAAFEQKLGKEIIISKFCHLTGALGTALQLIDTAVTTTAFKGLHLYKKEIPISAEICDLCVNHCKLKLAEVDGEKVAYGFLCGRDYSDHRYVNANNSGFDLLKVRKKAFSFTPTANLREKPVIGLPYALHLVEDMALWKMFFDLLGLKTITSESYFSGIKDGKRLAHAEFCAPMSDIHGHTKYLHDKVDYIFLPFYLERPTLTKEIKRHYCYYTQFSPSVLASTEGIDKSKIISPLIRTLKSDLNIKAQLFLTLRRIGAGVTAFQISSAWDRAIAFQEKQLAELQVCFTKEIEDKSDINVVFLGRPYTILSPAMNKGIPEIFGKHGIKTFFQDMVHSNDDDRNSIDAILEALHWHYASKILEATNAVAKINGCYPVFITSFKCTPDSFITEYFKDIMSGYDKPYLILQLDEHDSSVGYETRIEAAIRSFRNHFKLGTTRIPATHLPSVQGITYKKANFVGKTILLPHWDTAASRITAAAIRGEGINAYPLEETAESIQRGLSTNNGQCIPLNIIAQETIEYIEKYKLDPAATYLWLFASNIACNIKMYPFYIKKILENYGKGMEKLEIYVGDITLRDISIRLCGNIYFSYMFGGLVKKLACGIRPYEIHKGETDAVLERSLQILEETFEKNQPKDEALDMICKMFASIEKLKTNRPKVAIFGDLYARDNDVFNQNLIRKIESYGGEVISTPYTEYSKLIASPYIKKWIREGLYLDAAAITLLKKTMMLLERRYYKYFEELLEEPMPLEADDYQEVLNDLNVQIENTGESLDNIIKIHALVRQYPDISLFVQTNPAYCCPSLVSEAMSRKIEERTGIPIVTIEYDGTGGCKNEDIIPYIKYPRPRPPLVENKIPETTYSFTTMREMFQRYVNNDRNA